LTGRAGFSRWGLGLALVFFLVIFAGAGYWLYRSETSQGSRNLLVFTWLRNPQRDPDWAVQAGERCSDAPFQMPTYGFIGFLWGDSFRIGHRHQGIDIFAGTDVNLSPVYAAYSGYLTRLLDWKSSVIVRVPDDPLQPGRQIWTYYTHMAGSNGASFIAPDFPPGTHETFVEAGQLVGYQGNYSGDPGNPVGVHLHFSIILDNGEGSWLNELEFQNTLDPSPYLGLNLNASEDPQPIPVCDESL
jgi:murein DD-endopeptidase MepM/ murein hydrolase activator NlpD